jgi:hypothetical protein
MNNDSHIQFECPNCTHILAINAETLNKIMNHMYDHVMDCEVCFNEAIDMIFSNFLKDGFAPNSSAIRQCLKYFDKHLLEKMEDKHLENKDDLDTNEIE